MVTVSDIEQAITERDYVEVRTVTGELARFQKVSDGNMTLGQALAGRPEYESLLSASNANLPALLGLSSMGSAVTAALSTVQNPNKLIAESLQHNPTLRALAGTQHMPDALAKTLTTYGNAVERIGAQLTGFEAASKAMAALLHGPSRQVSGAFDVYESAAALVTPSTHELLGDRLHPCPDRPVPVKRESTATRIIVPTDASEQVMLEGHWSPIGAKRPGRPKGFTWPREALIRGIETYLASEPMPSLMGLLLHLRISESSWKRYSGPYGLSWTALLIEWRANGKII